MATVDSVFSTCHRGYDTNLVLRFRSSGTVRCVPGGVLPGISKDYLVWIFVPRRGPLNTEDEGTVNLRNAGNYSPDVTSHPTAVRTSNVAVFGAGFIIIIIIIIIFIYCNWVVTR